MSKTTHRKDSRLLANSKTTKAEHFKGERVHLSGRVKR